MLMLKSCEINMTFSFPARFSCSCVCDIGLDLKFLRLHVYAFACLLAPPEEN